MDSMFALPSISSVHDGHGTDAENSSLSEDSCSLSSQPTINKRKLPVNRNYTHKYELEMYLNFKPRLALFENFNTIMPDELWKTPEKTKDFLGFETSASQESNIKLAKLRRIILNYSDVNPLLDLIPDDNKSKNPRIHDDHLDHPRKCAKRKLHCDELYDSDDSSTSHSLPVKRRNLNAIQKAFEGAISSFCDPVPTEKRNRKKSTKKLVSQISGQVDEVYANNVHNDKIDSTSDITGDYTQVPLTFKLPTIENELSLKSRKKEKRHVLHEQCQAYEKNLNVCSTKTVRNESLKNVMHKQAIIESKVKNLLQRSKARTTARTTNTATQSYCTEQMLSFVHPSVVVKKLLSKDLTSQFAAGASLSIKCTAKLYLQLLAHEKAELSSAPSSPVHESFSSDLSSPAKVAATSSDPGASKSSSLNPGTMASCSGTAESCYSTATAIVSTTANVISCEREHGITTIKKELTDNLEPTANLGEIASMNIAAAAPVFRPKLELPELKCEYSEQNLFHGCCTMERSGSNWDRENDCNGLGNIDSFNMNSMKLDKVEIEEVPLELESYSTAPNSDPLCGLENFAQEKLPNCNSSRELESISEACVQGNGTEEFSDVGSHLENDNQRVLAAKGTKILGNQECSLLRDEQNIQTETSSNHDTRWSPSVEPQREHSTITAEKLKVNGLKTISSSGTMLRDRIENSTAEKRKVDDASKGEEETDSAFVERGNSGRAILQGDGAGDAVINHENGNASVAQEDHKSKGDASVECGDRNHSAAKLVNENGFYITEPKEALKNQNSKKKIIEPECEGNTVESNNRKNVSKFRDAIDTLTNQSNNLNNFNANGCSYVLKSEKQRKCIVEHGLNHSDEEKKGGVRNFFMTADTPSSDSDSGNDSSPDGCSNSTVKSTLVDNHKSLGNVDEQAFSEKLAPKLCQSISSINEIKIRRKCKTFNKRTVPEKHARISKELQSSGLKSYEVKKCSLSSLRLTGKSQTSSTASVKKSASHVSKGTSCEISATVGSTTKKFNCLRAVRKPSLVKLNAITKTVSPQCQKQGMLVTSHSTANTVSVKLDSLQTSGAAATSTHAEVKKRSTNQSLNLPQIAKDLPDPLRLRTESSASKPIEAVNSMLTSPPPDRELLSQETGSGLELKDKESNFIRSSYILPVALLESTLPPSVLLGRGFASYHENKTSAPAASTTSTLSSAIPCLHRTTSSSPALRTSTSSTVSIQSSADATSSSVLCTSTSSSANLRTVPRGNLSGMTTVSPPSVTMAVASTPVATSSYPSSLSSVRALSPISSVVATQSSISAPSTVTCHSTLSRTALLPQHALNTTPSSFSLSTSPSSSSKINFQVSSASLHSHSTLGRSSSNSQGSPIYAQSSCLLPTSSSTCVQLSNTHSTIVQSAASSASVVEASGDRSVPLVDPADVVTLASDSEDDEAQIISEVNVGRKVPSAYRLTLIVPQTIGKKSIIEMSRHYTIYNKSSRSEEEITFTNLLKICDQKGKIFLKKKPVRVPQHDNDDDIHIVEDGPVSVEQNSSETIGS